MAEWPKVSAGAMVMGLFIQMITMSGDQALGGLPNQTVVDAMHIVGFICLMMGALLAMASAFGDSKLNNQPVAIVFTIFGFLSAIFIVAGIALYADRAAGGVRNKAYGTTLHTCAALLGFLGGVFGIMALVRSR